MALLDTAALVLDGEALEVGDGVSRNRALSIGAGEYATPLWLRTESGLVVRVDALPWQGVIPVAELQALSEEPGESPINRSRVIGAEHLAALSVASGLSAESLARIVASRSLGAEHDGEAPDHPNEPADMMVITDRPFSALDEGWNLVEFDGTGESIVTSGYDGTPPMSGPSVIRFEYLEGQSGGGPNGRVGSHHFGQGYTTVYVHLGVQLSDAPNTFWGHDPSGVAKQGFLRVQNPNTGGGNQTFVRFVGNDDGPIGFDFEGQKHCCGNSFRLFNANQGSNTLTRGVWHELEYLFIANTPGVQNGILRAWKDGVLTHEHTDFGPLDSDEGPGFEAWLHSLIWGGTGDTMPHDFYAYYDHIYISGKN